MTAPKWREIAEFFGIAAIVGSLIFVGLQMRQAQEIAIADAYSELASSYLARSELVTMHSDLIAKANRGEEFTDAESIALEQFVLSMWQVQVFAASRWKYLGIESGGRAGYFGTFLCKNNGIIEIWESLTNWVRNQDTSVGIDSVMAVLIRDVDAAILNCVGD